MSVTGILFYVLLGGLMALAAFCVYSFHRKNHLDWQSMAYAIAAILLVPFGLAWAYMSMLEGEPQAAVMGIVMFSGTGVFFGFLSWWRARPVTTDNEQRSEGSTGRTAVTPGKIAAIVLLVLFVLSLPVSLFVKNVGDTLFSAEKAGVFIVDNIISDAALPKSIKKALVAQVRQGAASFTLEQRLMLGMTGSVDESEWVALFDLFVPEQERVALTQQAAGASFAWLDSDQVYPELVIPTGKYAEALESHAEEVIPWIYDSMLFPVCSEEQESRYARGDFGDDLQILIGCRPASVSRLQLIPHAAELLKNELRSQSIPQSVSLSEQLNKAGLTAEKLSQQKRKIKTFRTVSLNLWLLPMLLLVAALACVVRSSNALAAWLKWPLVSVGLLGWLLARNFMSPTGFFAGTLSAPPEGVPPAAFAIIKKLLLALFLQSGETLIMLMTVALVAGLVLLLLPLLISGRKGNA